MVKKESQAVTDESPCILIYIFDINYTGGTKFLFSAVVNQCPSVNKIYDGIFDRIFFLIV